MGRELLLRRLKALQKKLIELSQAISTSTDKKACEDYRLELREVQLELKSVLDQLERHIS